MTPFEGLLVVVGVLLFFMLLDAYKRKSMNIIHFSAFFFGILLIITFGIQPKFLDVFGSFFGLQRGSDLIVYVSIIFLAYLYFELLHNITKNKKSQTDILINYAIYNFSSTVPDLNNLKNKRYAFLVRCYNEENNIGNVMDDIISNGYENIVIVDDGSNDNSADIIKQKMNEYNDKFIVYLKHLINRGGGSANKTGFEFFRRYGDYYGFENIITFDADGQMNVKDMEKFIKYEKDYDILLGSRFKQDSKAQNMPFSRKLILFGSRFITFIFNGVWLTDPHNGFRLIKLYALKKMDIFSDNMTYASEIVDNIRRLNLKYKEIPVNIKYTEESLKKGQKNSNALKILIDIIYNKFFYR